MFINYIYKQTESVVCWGIPMQFRHRPVSPPVGVWREKRDFRRVDAPVLNRRAGGLANRTSPNTLVVGTGQRSLADSLFWGFFSFLVKSFRLKRWCSIFFAYNNKANKNIVSYHWKIVRKKKSSILTIPPIFFFVSYLITFSFC